MKFLRSIGLFMTYRISFLFSNHFIIIIIVDYFVILFPVGSQSDDVYFPPPRPSKRSLNGDTALNINPIVFLGNANGYFFSDLFFGTYRNWLN